jgi:WD40 repeat protein
MVWLRCGVWLVLTAVAATASAGEPRAIAKEAPLPPGAIARLGSYRFYHGPRVECAVLSPDGTRVASSAAYPIYQHFLPPEEKCDHERVIILWDARTGERIRELETWEGPLHNLAFSPDGKRLAATCGRDLFVFEVESGQRFQVIKLGDYARRLRFSADGKHFFISEGGRSITKRETEGGKLAQTWKPPQSPSEWIKENEGVMDGFLSPDGKHIAWHIWQYPDYSKLPPGVIPPPPVPRATTLIVADALTSKPIYRKDFAEGRLDAFTFSPDGRRFYISGAKLTAFDTASGKQLFAFDAGDAYRFTLSPDGRHVVVSSGRCNFSMWDLETGKKLHDIGAGFLRAFLDLSPQLFSADGKTLVLATHSTLRLFDAATGKERAVPAHRTPVTPRFSADGKTLFTTCHEERRSWDASSGKPKLLTLAPRRPWEGEEISHNNHVIYFLDMPRERFRVRDRATGKVQCQLETGRGSIYGHFTPDATRVVVWQSAFSSGDFEGFQLYDAMTGKKTCAIPTVDRIGYYPALSPDSRIVGWPDRANAVHLHDVATGKLLRTLRSFRPLPKKECNDAGLVFSPDTEFLIVTTYNHELFSNPNNADKWNTLPTRVFHVRTGRELSRFYSNPEKTRAAPGYSCAACSPDGRLLAVAEPESGIIRLIEMASGQVRAEFAGHRHGVNALAFSPDGRTLASGGEDNMTFLWDVIGTTAAAADKRDLPALWTELASADGKRAGAALASLLKSPGPRVAFLKDRLRPETADQKRLSQLLADLDGTDFARREAAIRALGQLGDPADVQLRQRLDQKPSLETKRRIEDLLAKLESRPLSSATLQALRGVEALERIGTPEARKVLEALAEGAADARLTQHARASLSRLAR